MDHKSIEKFILALPEVRLDYPFGENTAVYKVGLPASGKMFALIKEKSDPLNISLKCDPKLAEVLREKYETIMPGYHLNKKHWNTIVLTGQLPLEDVQALIRHSYDLASGAKTDTPTINSK